MEKAMTPCSLIRHPLPERFCVALGGDLRTRRVGTSGYWCFECKAAGGRRLAAHPWSERAETTRVSTVVEQSDTAHDHGTDDLRNKAGSLHSGSSKQPSESCGLGFKEH